VTARFYIDEDTSDALARVLRARGFDAVSAREAGAGGLPDDEQLDRASRDNRAIVTYNFRDFIVLHRRALLAGHHHGGIIVSYRQYRIGELGLAADGLARIADRHPGGRPEGRSVDSG
jgi:hypothetical protein